MAQPLARPSSHVNAGVAARASHAHRYALKKKSVNWDFKDRLYIHEDEKKCAVAAQAKQRVYHTKMQPAKDQGDEVRRMQTQLEAVQDLLQGIKLTPDEKVKEYRSPFAPGPDPNWYPHMLFEAKDYLERKLSDVSTGADPAAGNNPETKPSLACLSSARHGTCDEAVFPSKTNHKYCSADGRGNVAASHDTATTMGTPSLVDDKNNSKYPGEGFDGNRLAMLTYRPPTPPLRYRPKKSSKKRQRDTEDDVDREGDSGLFSPGLKRVRFTSFDNDKTYAYDEHVPAALNPSSSATAPSQTALEEPPPQNFTEEIAKPTRTYKIRIQLTARNLKRFRAWQAQSTNVKKKTDMPLKLAKSPRASSKESITSQKERALNRADI
ncbi:hypothetical protein BP6252_04720 [Coleophoma cylindrospora]|uniref:Uncharacterized protein n=1 Tax=Coleophoma cylindrospora TaxID=1849047 RepID=A0A3D8S198_9HELO|nr:hypothetical protein BP6252_04720 [Coleophoma cylindrospora]